MYAENLGVSPNKWLFLTGDKDFTLDLADDFLLPPLKTLRLPVVLITVARSFWLIKRQGKVIL